MTTTRTDLLERAPAGVLPENGETVLCGVSGGLDSMCLLSMLDAWCGQRGGRVIAAHFNHRLRGAEADRDEAFVRETCGRWGIPLTAGGEDVGAFARREGQTVEEAARTLRYAFLRRAAKAAGCRRIYTAHHAGDNAETVLLNLIRGTGLRGLTGMDWQREGLCRPLLEATREELEDYAARWGIPHVEDGTNGDPEAASRNFLRLRVMPLLRELNPRAVEHIGQTARRLQSIDRSMEREVEARAAQAEVREGRLALPIEALLEAPEAVRPRMLLELLDRLGAGRKDVGAAHLEALLEMAGRAEDGGESRVSLPHGVTARTCRRQLIFELRPRGLTEVPLLPHRPQVWGAYTLTLLDRPEGEGLRLGGGAASTVTVGPCPAGGRLTLPLPGVRGARSVKRLCLDRGISPEERDRLPAIYADGRLAAVWRLGVDAAFLPEGDRPVRFIKIEKDREADGI